MAASAIELPFNWDPRSYQLPLWRALESGKKRAMIVWHRRAGKDDVYLHWTARCTQLRPANYWHMLPVKEQARKAIWTAVNPHTGKRRIDEAFPIPLRKTTRDQEMMIEFKSGATWQVVGSDNFDTSVGAAPAGLVFSEWALADPQAYGILRPILLENKGWALFNTTPRGRNHALDTLKMAQANPDEWFSQVLTANDTGIFAAGDLERERLEYIALYGPDLGEAMFKQEYLCSFEGAVLGAFYAAALDEIERKNQITRVPYDKGYPVTTAWDLGVDDATAIWFIQQIGREVAVIDYYEEMNRGLPDIVTDLKAKGYQFDRHLLPHDAGGREKQTGKSYKQQLEDLRLAGEMVVLDRAKDAAAVLAGINQGRTLFPRCVFDTQTCKRGLNALRNYRAEWNEDKKILSQTPVHDWASHGADAWRALATGLLPTAGGVKANVDSMRSDELVAEGGFIR